MLNSDEILQVDGEKKINDFHNLCRNRGLRITPQRTAIYKALISTTEHPSAEMLHGKIKPVFPNISLDTVNRTLLTLAKIGAAFIVEGSGDAKRFDGGMENHQHFKCVKCRRIIDFHHEPYDEIAIPSDIQQEFTILRTTVYMEGICKICETPKEC